MKLANGWVIRRINESKRAEKHGCIWGIRIQFFSTQWLKLDKLEIISHLITEEAKAFTDLDNIKVSALVFYQKLFNQVSYWTIFLKLVVKKKLTSAAACQLSRDVTSLKIKHSLFQMHPDKTLGPDNLMLISFRKIGEFWGKTFAKQLFLSLQSRLLHKVNHTFVTLVPKLLMHPI